MLRPQIVTSILGAWLLVAGLTSILGPNISETSPTTQAPSVQGDSSRQSLKVIDAVGRPSSTSDYLQGSKNVQSEVGDVEQPGTDASQLLQPNSGRRSFTQQDELPQ